MTPLRTKHIQLRPNDWFKLSPNWPKNFSHIDPSAYMCF